MAQRPLTEKTESQKHALGAMTALLGPMGALATFSQGPVLREGTRNEYTGSYFLICGRIKVIVHPDGTNIITTRED